MPAEAIVEETETTDDAFYSAPDEGGKEAVDADETASVDEVEAENPTALLPKTALGTNPKPGDTITVKVLKVFDDEVSVELSSKPSAKASDSKSANEEIDEMAGGGEY